VTITLNGKPLRLEYARSCTSTSRGILNVAGTNGSPTGIARPSARLPQRDAAFLRQYSRRFCHAASSRQQAMRRVQVQGLLRLR